MSSLTIIAAMSPDGVIGDSQVPGMLWYIPKELAHFKEMTTGKTCIVGRRTAQQMPMLRDRRVFVLTKSDDTSGIPFLYAIVRDDDVLANLLALNEEIMVIGGREIYERFIDVADKMILTKVNQKVKGDILFPDISSTWKPYHVERFDNDGFSVTYYCK